MKLLMDSHMNDLNKLRGISNRQIDMIIVIKLGWEELSWIAEISISKGRETGLFQSAYIQQD